MGCKNSMVDAKAQCVSGCGEEIPNASCIRGRGTGACGRCRGCSSCGLCGRRVLMVGGITKMEDRYRKVVESRGGVFDYHDGYMRNGSKSLEGVVRRADMVLCPVNCNSHTACGVVKTLGKKYRKLVLMLSGSSLSAVVQAMEQAEAIPAGYVSSAEARSCRPAAAGVFCVPVP